MYLTYFDESGDTGVVNSPTAWFVLNAVLVHETAWLETLDALRAFRRGLRTKYGIPVQNEIKALDFRYGRGPFTGLHVSRKQRFDIYRQFMEFEATLKVRTFSVAIGKAGASARGWEPRTVAWQLAIERVQRFCESNDDYATIFPDEGHGFFIRTLMRQMRRSHYIPNRFGGPARLLRIQRVLEDPNERPVPRILFCANGRHERIRGASTRNNRPEKACPLDPLGQACRPWRRCEATGSQWAVRRAGGDQEVSIKPEGLQFSRPSSVLPPAYAGIRQYPYFKHKTHECQCAIQPKACDYRRLSRSLGQHTLVSDRR